MKTFLVLLLVAAVAVARANESEDELQKLEKLPEFDVSDGTFDEDPSFLETMLQQLPAEANIGYVPESVPFDNPSTMAEPVPSIPSTPDCTVRPQTIVEIKRMRRSAARIAAMIQTEITIMEKRKTYIEQMTSYLNDRIRELNKVKAELAAENKWIELSNNRIKELAQKEKLIKLQDVLSCFTDQQKRLMGEGQSKSSSIAALTTQAGEIQKAISAIKTKMASATAKPAGK